MLTRQVQYAAIWGVLSITFLWSSSVAVAAELNQLNKQPSKNTTELSNDNANDLPPQSASDSQGNRITLPTETSSALEYRADDIYLKPSLQQHIDANQSPHFSSSQTRPSMVDDPSCRWLNNRIKHLQKKQRQTQHSQFSHYQDEIDIREDEWACLKCATSGPGNVDRGACQHKR